MISLIAFSDAHIDALLGWFPTEADVVQWAGPTLDFPLDRRQFEAMLAESRTEPPSRLAWMATADDGRIVGHVQLAIDYRDGVGRLARVAIAPAERGHGYGVQMLERVIERGFSDPDMERIELNVYSFNTAALRTYEKLGFVREGMRRSSVRVGKERWDTVMMGLLRSEYPASGEKAAPLQMVG
jgi:RimJ/RimL family protein N-acetyltransferase